MERRHWNSGIREPIRWARPAAPLVLVLVLCIALLGAAAPASSGGPPYLAVNSTTPAANALDVAGGGNITVEFDYAVNGATVTEDTFNVDGSLSGPVGGTYSGGGTTTMTFDPTADFEHGETVTVTLTTGIEGEDSRTLEASMIWQFVVEASYSYFADSGQSLGSAESVGVSLGDLDGDGDLDAFVANNLGGNRVWLNDGSGVFTDSGQSVGSSWSQGVALGDLDGDGDLDAFVANGWNEANRVWLNAGNSTFTDSGLTLGTSGSWGVCLGDLDGDGDLDAFVANHGVNRVWLNGGTGDFFDSGQSLGSQISYGVSLGDLDGDGDLDAFVAKYNGPNRVWLNDGSGVFSDSGQSLGTQTSYGVSLGDLDGDGDLDAFVANDGASRVWLNGGTGAFTDSGQSLGYEFIQGVWLGDLDGDGDLDAFVANVNQANRVWLNGGGGTFTDSGQSLGSSWSMGVCLGDVDDDGDLDAFVANRGANRVWLNVKPPGYDQGYEDGYAEGYAQGYQEGFEACAQIYLDVTPPSGAVHAHDNYLAVPNRKPAEVVLSGYVRDALSIARDGGGTGVSSAWLLIDGTDTVALTLAPDGTFEVTCEFTCSKGAVYTVELYATDTNPVEDGGPNEGLVDQTYVRVR